MSEHSLCLRDNNTAFSEGEAGHARGMWDFDKDVLQTEHYSKQTRDIKSIEQQENYENEGITLTSTEKTSLYLEGSFKNTNLIMSCT